MFSLIDLEELIHENQPLFVEKPYVLSRMVFESERV